MADVKAIIEKQSGQGAEIYSKAVEDFKARLENEVKSESDTAVKTETAVKTDSAVKTAASGDADNKTSSTPPTKTDNEPTKTTK